MEETLPTDPPGTDYGALAMALIRHWRADRSQVGLSAELGFASNTLSHWETGRRTCRASVALRMAEIAHPGTLATLASHSRNKWDNPLHPDTPEGIALLLGATMDHRSAVDVANALGVSRHVVGRWLRADAEPSLPSFLRFLDATASLEWVVSVLAPGFALEGLLPGADPRRPVPAAIALVSLALDLSIYAELPHHDSRWLAGRCNVPVERVEQALQELRHMGAIQWNGTHWTLPDTPRTVRGNIVRRPEPCGFDDLRAELSEITAGRVPQWEKIILSVATRPDLVRVTRILNHAASQLNDLLRKDTRQGDLLVIRMDATQLIPPDRER